jgi:ribose transport system permease protein
MARTAPFKPADAFVLTGQPNRHRIAPIRLVSDIVSKRWMEGAVPLGLALVLSAIIVASTAGFTTTGNLELILREVSEKGLLAIGLTVVLVGGGIDLSVGSITGVVAIWTLIAMRVWALPVPVIALGGLLVGLLLGAINGALIAHMKLRPFITTLVTLLTFRSLVQFLQSTYRDELAMPRTTTAWSFIGKGSIAGIQTSVVIFVVLLVIAHVMLTRSRWGWWVTAVGSDRRSARRNSIPVARVQFMTYALSGLMCGVSGLILSARQGSTSDQVGTGYEMVVLTAVVLGGVSLRGGRGSVMRATVGMFVVAMIGRAVVIKNLENGWYIFLLALVLLAFAVLDMKWGKYRAAFASKIALDPGQLAAGALVDVTDQSSTWAINNRLTEATPIGIGTIEGAEDCALDDEGRLYCGDRRGWIWRFSGENFEHSEVFARTGGLPLGHAWDRDGTLVVAVGGMGLCRIYPDGSSKVFGNQTRRTRTRVFDDSAIRFADDLDIAPDGSIYFSDFSTRINAADYHIELIEYRPNGRLMRWDPDTDTVDTVIENYVFPNGVCTSHDGQSVLVASTGLFRVDRLWISGPKQGQLEPVLENLPGYPDNVNRASDGNYWMTFVAMRTPMSDLMLKFPALRRRMSKELPADEWLIPQLNVSCVFKFSESGEIVDVLWDSSLEQYPMVTSINEYQGELFVCGLQNNRVGRLKLPNDQVGDIDPRGGAQFARPMSGSSLEVAQ